MKVGGRRFYSALSLVICCFGSFCRVGEGIGVIIGFCYQKSNNLGNPWESLGGKISILVLFLCG